MGNFDKFSPQNVLKRLRLLENKNRELSAQVDSANYTDVYSTTEFQTNKTYLGKPVYRKVIAFNGTTLRNTDSGYITHNLNIDSYLKVELATVAKNNDVPSFFTPPEMQERAADPNIGGIINYSNNDVLFETWNIGFIGGGDWHLILEYTKN